MTAEREPVPAWVHDPNVLPPTDWSVVDADDEPAYRCGVCGVDLGPRYEHPCAGPSRWGWTPLAIVVLLALAAAAWRLLR